jgi:hypothetical protein
LPKIICEVSIEAQRVFVVRSVDDGVGGRRDRKHVLEQLRVLQDETRDLEENALDLSMVSP